MTIICPLESICISVKIFLSISFNDKLKALGISEQGLDFETTDQVPAGRDAALALILKGRACRGIASSCQRPIAARCK